jgi:hypothetical protein
MECAYQNVKAPCLPLTVSPDLTRLKNDQAWRLPRSRVLGSFPFETLRQAANLHVESARFHHPLVIFANEGQIIGRQFE